MTIENFLRSGIDALRSKPPKLIDNLKRVLVSPIYVPYLFIKGISEDKSRSKKSIFLYTIFFLVIGLATEDVFRDKAIQLHFPTFLPGLLEIFTYGIIGSSIMISFFGLLVTSDSLFSEDSRFLRKIQKEYVKNLSLLFFERKEYAEAAELLKVLKPTPYQKLLENHPKRIVDLLILSGAAWCFKGKIQRLVSLSAIKDDRSAEAKDD